MHTHASNTSFVTRRTALGLGLAGGLALAAGTPFHAGADPAAPAGVPQTWDVEADVVVVGYGGAGAAAAWEALTAGASVAILEAASNPGGSTDMCGGYITMAPTPLQEKLGFEDSADNLYEYLLISGGNAVSAEHCRVLADESRGLYDWLTGEIGVVFNESYQGRWPSEANYDAGLTCTDDTFFTEYAAKVPAVPRTHWVWGFEGTENFPTGPKNGSGFFRPLRDAVDALGPEVHYQTAARRLVVDPELGRVVGVEAEGPDGTLFVKAAKAVILCAGGFGYNEDMLEQFCPMVIGAFPIGTPGDDGSGIKMGMGVGADVRHLQDAYGHMNIDLGSLVGRDGFPGGPLSRGIMVSRRGLRFVAEDRYHTMAPARMWGPDYQQDFDPAYMIYDQAVADACPAEEVPSEENGLLAAKADTIAELEAALGMPAGALEATVAYYNACAAEGADPQFGKGADFVQPLENPPFYAAVASARGMFFTIGGLKIDTDAHVISALTQQPIAGLYSAGRNANDIFGTVYQGSGLSVASCYTFGRIAGKNAAAEEAWA